MARIFCQVVQRAHRITVIWSDGVAAFEPYDLAGDELLAVGRQARERHAAGLTSELPALGHQLFRSLFRIGDQQPAPAARAQTWLSDLASRGEVESFEVVSDIPSQVPWSLTCDRPAAEACWGRRFPLAVGRRVNPLRGGSAPEREPRVLVVIEEEAFAQLGGADRARLQPWLDRGSLVSKAGQFERRLVEDAPDVLVLLAPVIPDGFRLDERAIRFDQLDRWIADAEEGNPDPLVFFGGLGGVDDVAQLESALRAATSSLNGVLASESPWTAADAVRVAVEFLDLYLAQKLTVAEALMSLRQNHEAALLLAAYCPPGVHCEEDDDTFLEERAEPMTLPDAPFRALAAFEYEDRPLFLGREDVTVRGANLLDTRGVVGMLVTGAPSVGKTSFLQAGLLPFLEQDSVGYRVLRDRRPAAGAEAEHHYPLLVIRATSDPAAQLADALCAFCAQPLTVAAPDERSAFVDLPKLLRGALGTTDADGEVQPRELATAFQADARRLGEVLELLTRLLPDELVIAFDQGEDFLNSVEFSKHPGRARRFLDLLSQVAQTEARCKFVLSIRSASLGMFFEALPAAARAHWREVALAPLSENEMVEALLAPTAKDELPYTNEIPFEKYQFEMDAPFAAQVAAHALKEARRHNTAPLPLLQAAATLVYERQIVGRGAKQLGRSDANMLKGGSSSLLRLIQNRLRQLRLGSADVNGVFKLFGELVSWESDGTARRGLLSRADLEQRWTGGERVETVVNRGAELGLFDIQEFTIDNKRDLFVSVPQDAFGDVAQQWQQKSERSQSVADVLWIMIPMVLTAAALTFFVMRLLGPAETATDAKFGEKEVQQFIGEMQKATRPPQYRGLIAQADAALRVGNVLRARQHLLTEPALPGRREDLRAFEWQYLWNQANGHRFTLQGHRMTPSAVAASRDGALAATASLDGEIKVWKVQKGTLAASVPSGKNAVRALAFSPDGSLLAAAGDDKAIHIHDLQPLTQGKTESGSDDVVVLDKVPRRLEGHTDAVQALAFVDGLLASAGADGKVLLWDVSRDKPQSTLASGEAAVRTLAVSPDGKTLASAGDEARIQLWDVAGAKAKGELATPFRSIASLAFAPDGKSLAAGGEAKDSGLGQARVSDLDSQKEPSAVMSFGPRVTSVAFHPDGRSLAIAGEDHCVRLWDIATASERGQWLGHLGWVSSLTFARGALITASYDNTARIWPTYPTSTGPQFGHSDAVTALAFHENLLASAGRDGSLRLWDAAQGTLAKELLDQGSPISALQFLVLDNVPILAAGLASGEVRLWQLDTKEELATKELPALKGHGKAVTCLAAHQATKLLVSGSDDKTLVVWDVAAGKAARTLQTGQAVASVVFSRDGSQLIVGNRAGRLHLFDPQSGAALNQLPQQGHLGAVQALAPFEFETNQGKRPFLATGSADNTAALWVYDFEGSKYQRITMLTGHNQPVVSVAAVGTLVATASLDRTVKLWDVQGQERLVLAGHNAGIQAMAASSGWIATGGQDGVIRMWNGRTRP